ncbi:hypothetical protein [Polyangium sorediatum]|uniref:Lipoprotein n=1 Tax=Polyangium sorediatum TaxID=889274 RepID=A0ABT6P3X2_9BACT|nr:hypothetical protein [Polyangium sorediatum]MDI1435312.1 hypothetical protein [Polyangium sorediatum]
MAKTDGRMGRVLGLVAAAWVVVMAGCSGGVSGEGGGAAGGDGGGPTKTHKCGEGQLWISLGTTNNPYVMEAVTGTNGTFVDHCDESGYLVQYNCQSAICDSVNCEDMLTGVVVEEVFDCKGACKAGVCERGCPEADVALTVISVDSTGTTLNDAASGTGYTCTSVIDKNSNDGWACTGAEAVGATGKAGESTGSCHRGEGAFGVAFPMGNCFYLNCARSN